MLYTIEDVDQVIERTGCTYKEAKEALSASDGEVVDAIIYLEEKNSTSFSRFVDDFTEETQRTADTIVTKIRDAIREGNVTRIEVRKADGTRVASVKVNTGAALGGIVFLAGGAPLLIISGLVARYGLDYRFVIVRDDDSENIL